MNAVTTSQLLTTGLDAPTCKSVVLVRLVDSKQIIGRGTRAREDYGKFWFNSLDHTGTATRNFADPAFDGDFAFATIEEIDEKGRTKNTEAITSEEGECDSEVISNAGPFPPLGGDGPPPERRKFYFDGFFERFEPDARAVLNDLLEKYSADGEIQFLLSEVLKIPPISNRGNVAEIISSFGGSDDLRIAANHLQALLYAT